MGQRKIIIVLKLLMGYTVRPPYFADFGMKKNREIGGPRNREAALISSHDPKILV